MSQNQDATEALVPRGRPDDWKMFFPWAVGFGGGFAVVSALLLGAAFWWANRPKPWSDRSITAKRTQLMMQQAGEEQRFEFRYALTNHTNAEYALPSTDLGALMRKLPKDGSLEKVDGATWDSSIKIPPQQTIGVVFLVPYRFSEYNTSAAELEPEAKLTEFAGRRLKEIDGLVFFDYASKYKIEMPKNWDTPQKPEQKQSTEKKPSPLIPPDKGDVFDQVYACQEAEKLLQRCDRARVSLDSSPWIKYGGWPSKLRELPTRQRATRSIRLPTHVPSLASGRTTAKQRSSRHAHQCPSRHVPVVDCLSCLWARE